MDRPLIVALVKLACGSIAITAAGCAMLNPFATKSAFTPPEPSALAARIAKEGPRGNGVVDHFAVIIGGDTELRHRGNMSMAYQVLLEQGYARERIYIFDSEGDTPFFPLTDVTTRAAVELMFEHLARVVEPHDTLLIYVTGHGRRITAQMEEDGVEGTIGVSTLKLNPGEELSQEELSVLLQRLRPEVGIAFFDQCYGGQFQLDRTCNFVTITTAESNETSSGVTFPRAFWSAFRVRPLGESPTIIEAFRYAMVEDPATRLGMNKPRIASGCVNPSRLMLLGSLKILEGAVPAATTAAAPIDVSP